MPSSLPNQNPLSYFGVKADTPPNLIQATRAPTILDKGNNYPIGTIWINKFSGTSYQLTKYTRGVPSWEEVAGNGGYPITPYVVGAVGQAGYQSIQSAMDAAHIAGGAAVWILPGTYVENLICYPNTQVIGAVGFSDGGGTSAVIIRGMHTPPDSGFFVFRNVRLESATHIFSSAVAGTAHLVVADAFVAVTNGYLFNLPNWTGTFEMWDLNSSGGTNDGCVNNTGGATIFAFEAGLGAGTTNPMIVSEFALINSSEISPPVNFVTGADAEFSQTQCSGSLTFSNNSTGNLYNCHIDTGATAALTQSSTGTISLSNAIINTSASPAIAGAGAGLLTLASVTYLDSNTLAGTLTLGTSAEFSVGGTVVAQKVLRCAGDVAGVANTVSVSNVTDETLGAGAGTVLMKTGNPGNSSGWLKIYSGTNVRYVPYWTNISP